MLKKIRFLLMIALGLIAFCFDTGTAAVRYAYQGNVAVYEEYGQLGITDNNGTPLCEAQFDGILPFADGVAIVVKEKEYNGNICTLFGLLNEEGTIVASVEWESIKRYPQKWFVLKNDQQSIVMDWRGNIVLDKRNVIITNITQHHIFVDQYIDDNFLCSVIFNLRGDEVLTSTRPIESIFSIDEQSGLIRAGNHYAVFSGDEIIEMSSDIDRIDVISSTDEYYYVILSDGYQRTKIFNAEGITLLDSETATVEPYAHFSDNLICYKENGQYGFFNVKTAQVQIAPKYDYVIGFKNGYAAVASEGVKNWQMINTKGETLKIEARSILSWNSDLTLIRVLNDNGKYMWIRQDGSPSFAGEWDIALDFSEGYAWVCSGSYYGVIDENGNYATPLIYDDLLFCSYGTFAHIPNESYVILNKKGDIVGPVSVHMFNLGLDEDI